MPSGLFHENYRSDEYIFQTWFVRVWLIVFLLACILFPLVGSKYMISTMIEVGIAIAFIVIMLACTFLVVQIRRIFGSEDSTWHVMAKPVVPMSLPIGLTALFAYLVS